MGTWAWVAIKVALKASGAFGLLAVVFARNGPSLLPALVEALFVVPLAVLAGTLPFTLFVNAVAATAACLLGDRVGSKPIVAAAVAAMGAGWLAMYPLRFGGLSWPPWIGWAYVGLLALFWLLDAPGTRAQPSRT